MKQIIILNNIDDIELLKLELNGIKLRDVLRSDNEENIIYLPKRVNDLAKQTYVKVAFCELLDIETLKDKYMAKNDKGIDWIADNYEEIIKKASADKIIIGDYLKVEQKTVIPFELTKDYRKEEFDSYTDINQIIETKYEEILTTDDNTSILSKYFIRRCDIEKATICVKELDYTDAENILHAIEYFAMVGDLPNLDAVYYNNLEKIKAMDISARVNEIHPVAVRIINNYKRNFGCLTLHLKDQMQIQLDLLLAPEFDLNNFVIDIHNQIFDPKNNIDIKEQVLNIIINQMLEREIDNVNFFNGYIDLMTYTNVNQFSSKLLVKKVFDRMLIIAPNQLSYHSFSLLHKAFYHFTVNQNIFSEVNDKWFDEVLTRVPIEKVDSAPRVKLVSSSNRSKKVAVCISGMTRGNINKILENIMQNIGESLDADFFIHTWDEREIYPGTGGIGHGENKEWSLKYYNQINNILPPDINTVGEMKALMPKTSEIIFTPKNIENKIEVFENVLGDRLKKIKLDNQDEFEKLLTDGEYTLRDNYNQAKMYYGINEAFSLLEEYQNEENIEYGYVMRLRIDTMFVARLTKKSLQKISINDIMALPKYSTGPEDSIYISRYETAKRVAKLWEKAAMYNSISPYAQYGTPLLVDAHKLLYSHIMYSKIHTIRPTIGDFKYTNLSKVQLPDINEAVMADLEINPNEAVENYFTELTKIYGTEVRYNDTYKKIKNIQLEKVQFVRDSIEFTIVITGTELDSINASDIKFRAESIPEQESFAKESVYHSTVNFTSRTNEKIVCTKAFSNGSLIFKNIWRGTISILDGNELEYNINSNIEQHQFYEWGISYVTCDAENNLIFGTK